MIDRYQPYFDAFFEHTEPETIQARVPLRRRRPGPTADALISLLDAVSGRSPRALGNREDHESSR
jgi:hypothetical protein